MENIVKITIQNLESNGFAVRYFETADEAAAAILGEVKPGETAGFGGSMTLENMRIRESLESRGIVTFYHGTAKSPAERASILENEARTDVYFASSNAVTSDGRLVNVDGSGNRVSSMAFGHKRVYIVAGTNKIVKNYEEAIVRIKNVASPLNTKRLSKNTPCAKTGKCENCDSPERICNVTLVHDRPPYGFVTSVFLVGESLGY